MSRSLRRGALAATAIVFSIASLSACAAGNDAQTLGVRPDNAETSVDNIKIQNATVIAQPELTAEGPAVISATVFNNDNEQQTIDAITLPGTNAQVKLSPATGSGPITVPALGSVVIGGAGNASAVVENGREATRSGGVQEVVFRFSETGDVKMQAFVVPAKGFFEGFGPSTLPKPPEKPEGTPSGSPETTPSGTPSEGATGAAGEPGNGESGEPGTPADSSSASHSADAGH
ncbi:DUF461 domain-containing protein [Streptomyces lunaelactis]|uniref:DUF461 domain-containing protein n=1 Tax=Streptomyces lunaelactis TaxID=1535768 RepID=UPI001585CDD6|nr:DUF461 domain-containing protein [Streptomyces lunaelactis]NUL03407.1 DUF461 domain-containing protein [Streptomyces lunaelactis]